jgi:hypothetical protein
MNQCRCVNTTHKNHQGNHCAAPATENDDYCKVCHDKAADEAMQAILPTNQPVNVGIRINDNAFNLRDSISFEKQSEFYKRNPWAIALAAAFAITLAGFGLVVGGWVGTLIGLVISLLAIPLLPPTVTKVREIERTSSR